MDTFQVSLGDHASRPRNAGVIENATAIGNGSLEDERPFVTLYVVVEEDRVIRSSFQTRGCGYAIAATSALTVWLEGRELEACRRLTPIDICHWFGGLPAHKQYCAELVCDALNEALDAIAA